MRHEAEARAAAIEKRLANLETELASLRADAKREMESEGARIQEETKRLVAKAGEQAEQEIAAMSKAAENELRRHASLLALELAEKKLKARMSPETDASLVERFVAGLGWRLAELGTDHVARRCQSIRSRPGRRRDGPGSGLEPQAAVAGARGLCRRAGLLPLNCAPS